MVSSVIKKNGWGTMTQVTFPFTPSSDGVVLAVVTPPNVATSYVYINENDNAYFRMASDQSRQYTLSFPVRKGKTYSISSSVNYAFNGGVRFLPIA